MTDPQAELDLAPDLDVAPGHHRGGLAVERIGERGQRAGRERVVGVERHHVPGGGRTHSGHPRGGEATVRLVDHADTFTFDALEHAKRLRVAGAVVDHDELVRLLVAQRVEGVGQRLAVVEAWNDDCDAWTIHRDHASRATFRLSNAFS